MSQPPSPGKSQTASSPNSPGKSKSGKFHDHLVAGSRTCPYKLLVVGGGPSGCSVVVRAARIGMLRDLCEMTHLPEPAEVEPKAKSPSVPSSSGGNESTTIEAHAGVCLVDAGPLDRFGGGRLQDYIISSNTWINKFASNVVEEKPETLPPETVVHTPFEPLLQASSTHVIEAYGNRTGPLKLVGGFLRDVGQRTMAALQAYPSSCRVLVRTKVESIQRVLDPNTGLFACWKVVCTPLSTVDAAGTGESLVVYALHVVLASGGHQTVPQFHNPAHRNKVLLSDVVCTSDGVAQLKQRLQRSIAQSPGTGARIVVVGGSHSAFSAAWVCLNLVNDPADPNSTAGSFTPTSKFTPGTPPLSLTGQGQVRLGPSAVCLLHRSSIRVFYATRADAEHDHYSEGQPLCVNKVTGNINPFGGLRGDAKELWRAVRSGREGRVRLLQVKQIPVAAPGPLQAQGPTTSFGSNSGGSAATSGSGGVKQSIVEKMLDEAAVIVWAAGYHTNLIPVLDHDGQPITFSAYKGQVNVDEHASLLLHEERYHGPLRGHRASVVTKAPSTSSSSCMHKELPVGNLYGSGLGFGLKATLDNGELDGSGGRADGVAVYLKRGATLVLAHVLGTRVFGEGMSSWEERNSTLQHRKPPPTATGALSVETNHLAEAMLAAATSPSAVRAQTSKSPARSLSRLNRSSFASPNSNNNNASDSGPNNNGVRPVINCVDTASVTVRSPGSSLKTRPASAGRARTPTSTCPSPSAAVTTTTAFSPPISPSGKIVTANHNAGVSTPGAASKQRSVSRGSFSSTPSESSTASSSAAPSTTPSSSSKHATGVVTSSGSAKQQAAAFREQHGLAPIGATRASTAATSISRSQQQQPQARSFTPSKVPVPVSSNNSTAATSVITTSAPATPNRTRIVNATAVPGVSSAPRAVLGSAGRAVVHGDAYRHPTSQPQQSPRLQKPMRAVSVGKHNLRASFPQQQGALIPVPQPRAATLPGPLVLSLASSPTKSSEDGGMLSKQGLSHSLLS